jgi:hypothetical protein
MVVAGARPTQFRIARAGANAKMARARGNRHQRLQRMRDIRIGQTEVSVPALALDCDQRGLLETVEMPADRRETQACFLRQFRHGERRACEQRHQHVGAGRIADQRGDNRDIGTFFHSLRIPEVSTSVNVAVSAR